MDRPTHHSDEEIKTINATVDIGQVAEALGFTKDRSTGSRNSRKYGRDGDMIVVKDSHRYPGQEYLTLGKSKEEGDCGPVFNFAYHREGERNLGKTRKILRPFIGTLDGATATPLTVPAQAAEEAADRQDEWEALNETLPGIKRHVVNHLCSMGLTRETLEAFRGLIRADARRNACFVSRLHDGRIVGWSLRGTQNIKWRSNRGTKALFFGPAGKKKTEHLVVCESALDAISYWQPFRNEVDIMVSTTAGNTGDYGQVVGLARELQTRQVIIATDTDDGGRRQGETLGRCSSMVGLSGFITGPRI